MCMYVVHVNVRIYIYLYTAPEASWRRVFDPCTPLLFDLYHYRKETYLCEKSPTEEIHLYE